MASPKVDSNEFNFEEAFDFNAPRRSLGSPVSRSLTNGSLSPTSIAKTFKEGEDDHLLREKNDLRDLEKALPSHLNAPDTSGSRSSQAQFLLWTTVNTLATIGIVCNRCDGMLGSHH